MIKVKYIGDSRHEDDCRRLQKILAEHGYEASLTTCRFAWEAYSESMSAGWMMIDEYAFENISQHFSPITHAQD